MFVKRPEMASPIATQQRSPLRVRNPRCLRRSFSHLSPSMSKHRLSPRFTYEAETIAGLTPFAKTEMVGRFGKQIIFLNDQNLTAIRFQYQGRLNNLFSLRLIQAIYCLRHFSIPRPKALLGHQHFQVLLRDIQAVLALHPPQTFNTFRISAAGQDSRIFARIKSELQAHTGLLHNPEQADLLLRIRPAQKQGWEVLTRLTPRPLATRAWRVQDMPGALNATIAATMIERTRPHPDDCFLNLMCGSGTFLIERLAYGPAHFMLGLDVNRPALEIAQTNIAAAKLSGSLQLCLADVTAIPLPSNSFNVLCADLPWGRLVGSHQDNLALYPHFLAEVTRTAAPKARLALLTHELRLMEQIFKQFRAVWELQETIKIIQRGWQPRIYIAVKR